MRFKITLESIQERSVIPINYHYPLSAAIYKIIERADAEYSQFLHIRGYGKGYKFFTFSDINCPFKIKEDRLQLLSNEVEFYIAFHLPKASQTFVQGLFMSQEIDIADFRSKASFRVRSVEAMMDPLGEFDDTETIISSLQPMSPVVCGIKNEKGNYDFLTPDHPEFVSSLIYNWREKIRANYDDAIAGNAKLEVSVDLFKNPPRSRLITIKAGTEAETKIRGFMNFKLIVKAEKHFVDILMNCGICLYNAMGMGCMRRV